MKLIYFLFITFTVYFSGLTLMGYQNLNQILFSDIHNNALGVYFKEQISDKVIHDYKQLLVKNFPEADIKYWSPAEQYQDFVQTNMTSLEQSLNPDDIISTLPGYIEIKFITQKEYQSAIQSNLFKNEIVDSVATNNSWSDKFSSIVLFFNASGKFLFLFIFFSTAFIIVTAVRLISQMRIKEFYVRHFLGQSYFEIYRPTATLIVALSAVAYVAAMALVFISYILLKSKASGQKDLFFIYKKISFLSTDSILILATGLIVVVAISLVLSFKKVSELLEEN